MSKRIKIITYAHKRPDFIPIQFESIQRYFKNEYDYVVFNNAVDDQDLHGQIKEMCCNLGIECVDVSLDQDFIMHGGEQNFIGNKYTNPNLACSYPLVWTFNKYIKDEEYLCIIDSDMFFIDDFIWENFVDEETDLAFIPQWRDSSKIQYIWNAFVLLNFKKNQDLKNLDWHPGQINGNRLDVGGQTHYFLQKNSNLVVRYLCERSIREIKRIGEEHRIHYIQDGSVNYEIVYNKGKLIGFNQTGGHLKGYSEKRSFPHEEEKENFPNFISDKVLELVEIIENSKANLPSPEHIAFIGDLNFSNHFILHYKSGSNYLDFTTTDYNKLKTEGCLRIIKHLRNEQNRN